MAADTDIIVMMLLYNCAHDLPRALDSLAAQTYKKFHLIVVDDCSSDNSYEIASVYKVKFESFDLYKNPQNKGVINNLHDTLKLVDKKASNAEFFIWFCSDDWLDPDYLECTRRTLLDKPKASVCQSWFDYHDLSNGSIESHKLPSIETNQYRDTKIIFSGFVTDQKSGFYNQCIHGLMRIKILRMIYPNDKKSIENTSCTEISILIYMLINGPIIIHPGMMFHKIQSIPFTEKYPNDPLAHRYGDIFSRAFAALGHLPKFIRSKGKDTPILSVVLLWMHLLYYYGILCSALLLKDRYFPKRKT